MPELQVVLGSRSDLDLVKESGMFEVLDRVAIDSCLYMPPGVPVLLAGVGKAGLKNAAIAACQILAVADQGHEDRLREYLAENAKQAEFNIDIEEKS